MATGSKQSVYPCEDPILLQAMGRNAEVTQRDLGWEVAPRKNISRDAGKVKIMEEEIIEILDLVAMTLVRAVVVLVLTAASPIWIVPYFIRKIRKRRHA